MSLESLAPGPRRRLAGLPGLPKRPEHFPQLVARAEGYSRPPGRIGLNRIKTAIERGTPDLSIGARMVLLTYAGHLNLDQIDAGEARVFPGGRRMCAYLGVDPRTLRRYREELEHKGYLIRDTDQDNHPTEGRGVDLRLLLARLPELEGAAEAIAEGERERRQFGRRSSVFASARLSARAVNSVRPYKQSSAREDSNTVPQAAPAAVKADPKRISSCAVRPADELRAATSGPHSTSQAQAREGGTDGAQDRSARRASGLVRGKTARSSPTERLLDELLTTRELCPRLRPYLDGRALQSLDIEALRERIGQEIESFFDDPSRNHRDTWDWIWRIHGPRAIAVLGIAVTDPDVHDPSRYFGSFAPRRGRPSVGPLDLSTNFARLREIQAVERKARQAPQRREPSGPGADNPAWRPIRTALRRSLGEGRFGAWIAPLGFVGIDGGRLCLSAGSRFAADYIRRELLDDIRAAARSAGLQVDQVEILAGHPPERPN